MIVTCAFSHCGKDFDRNTTFQKYCCTAHRVKDWTIKHRQPKKRARTSITKEVVA